MQGASHDDKKLWGTETDADVELDPERLAAAMARAQAAVSQEHESDDRKRKYNSLVDGGGVTAEDMEAYRVLRSRGEDPLAAMRAAAVKAGGGDGYDLV